MQLGQPHTGDFNALQLKILTQNVISGILIFRENILESSQNVSETTPWWYEYNKSKHRSRAEVSWSILYIYGVYSSIIVCRNEPFPLLSFSSISTSKQYSSQVATSSWNTPQGHHRCPVLSTQYCCDLSAIHCELRAHYHNNYAFVLQCLVIDLKIIVINKFNRISRKICPRFCCALFRYGYIAGSCRFTYIHIYIKTKISKYCNRHLMFNSLRSNDAYTRQ